MSSSAFSVGSKPRKNPVRRKFHDNLTTKQFQRMFDRAHRDFFLKRGIDPDASRTNGNFEGQFGRKTER